MRIAPLAVTDRSVAAIYYQDNLILLETLKTWLTLDSDCVVCGWCQWSDVVTCVAYWSRSLSPAALLSGDDALLLDDETRRLIDDSHLLIATQRLVLLDVIGQGRHQCIHPLHVEQQSDWYDLMRPYNRQADSRHSVHCVQYNVKTLSDAEIHADPSCNHGFLERFLQLVYDSV